MCIRDRLRPAQGRRIRGQQYSDRQERDGRDSVCQTLGRGEPSGDALPRGCDELGLDVDGGGFSTHDEYLGAGTPRPRVSGFALRHLSAAEWVNVETRDRQRLVLLHISEPTRL